MLGLLAGCGQTTQQDSTLWHPRAKIAWRDYYSGVAGISSAVHPARYVGEQTHPGVYADVVTKVGGGSGRAAQAEEGGIFSVKEKRHVFPSTV